MNKITIEITYGNKEEMLRIRKKIDRIISTGVKSYSCENFKFAINKEVKKDFVNVRMVRFERINGNVCMILPSRMNF